MLVVIMKSEISIQHLEVWIGLLWVTTWARRSQKRGNGTFSNVDLSGFHHLNDYILLPEYGNTLFIYTIQYRLYTLSYILCYILKVIYYERDTCSIRIISDLVKLYFRDILFWFWVGTVFSGTVSPTHVRRSFLGLKKWKKSFLERFVTSRLNLQNYKIYSNPITLLMN